MLSVYVISVVPAATGVTVPDVVVVLMVPLVASDEAQALLVAAVPEPVKTVVEPIHTLAVPVIVGVGFTVTITFCVLLHVLEVIV